jgi:hypothetical protein
MAMLDPDIDNLYADIMDEQDVVTSADAELPSFHRSAIRIMGSYLHLIQ